MFVHESRGLLGVDSNTTSLMDTPVTNKTFFGFMEEEEEVGFTDMQTVFLACIATLIPLVFILLAGFIVRFLWRRFHVRKGEGYEGVLQREESSDPLAVKSLSVSGNILPHELKTSESQFSVTPAEEIEDLTPQSAMLSYGGVSCGSLPNHTAKSANGSIITMTLKNNHLIVETEERGVGVPGGATKTTTTKFTASSSPDENNVFVVEVQQTPLYPSGGSQEDLSSQMAQVHHPPEADSELEDLEEEEEEEEGGRMTKCGSTNTGLSQSDLSVSSAGSNNPSYRYGNQVGYEGGHFGYPQDVGYTIADDASGVTDKLPAVRWVASRPSVDVGLISDKISSDVEDDSIQEEQRRLGQGSTPEQGSRNGDEILMIDDEMEDSRTTEKGGKEGFSKTDADLAPEGKHLAAKKRGSLPIITPELYKQTKNLIIDKTTSRPVKFEKLSNETSPLDDARRGQGDAGVPRGMESIPETADGKPGLEYENPGFVAADSASS